MMTIEDCRQFYAEEIRLSANIRSEALVGAFGRVPREQFLGAGPWEVASPELASAAAGGLHVSYITIDDPRQLYHDILIVLDKQRGINNGQPSGLARWIQALELKAGDCVHHLGCGLGYYSAIIAETVGPEGAVIGSEINPALAARAEENLAAYPSVTVHAEDGATCDVGNYDAMLVNAGVTHPLPLWLERLKDGGRLVLPLTMATTPTMGAGVMVKIVRTAHGFSVGIVSPAGIYSCVGARDKDLEPVLKDAVSQGGIMAVKSVRRDQHEKTDSCVVHGAEVCLSRIPVG